MYLSGLYCILLLSHISNVFAFRGVLILSHAWGNKDINYIPNSAIKNNLRVLMPDFTVAAPDTTASYLGFLSGKLQNDNNQSNIVPEQNLHSIFNSINIPTAHYGAWPFAQAPAVDEKLISSDPRIAIKAATNFVSKHSSYFLTVFVPLVDVQFYSAPNILNKVEGVKKNGMLCRDVLRTDKTPIRYKNCPKQIYTASLRYEDQLLKPLIAKLKSKKAFIFWSSDHGPLSQHSHSNAAPYISLRGEQYSLYDGGIRTAARYARGAYPLFKIKSANAVDLLPSFAAIGAPKVILKNIDGINLFDSKSVRNIDLQWSTDRMPEGHCSNISPARAKQITVEGSTFMLLYDQKRTEIYPWNSGYQLQYANVNFAVPVRPKTTLPACELPKATGIKVAKNIPKPPRVIFNILADDTGRGDYSFTSLHGGKASYPSTPNIDALASSGVVLTQYYTAGSVCSPTRASIMTARNPFNARVGMHAVYDYDPPFKKLDPNRGVTPYLGFGVDNTYISSFLSNSSNLINSASQPKRVSAHFGKWHLNHPKTSSIGDQRYGFDFFKCYACDGPEDQIYDNSEFMFASHINYDIVKDALAYADKQLALGNNVYINIWFHNSHAPVNLLYGQAATLGFPDSSNPYQINGTSVLGFNEKPFQIYYASLKDQDNQLGMIRSWMVEKKLQQDVLIAYSSDNGPEAQTMYLMCTGTTEIHRGKKRSNGEGGTHAFAFLNWGTYLQGSTDQLFSSVDLYPTIAGLAGYDVTRAHDYNTFDGKDLSKCLTKNECAAIKSRSLVWEVRYNGITSSCIDIFPRYAIRKNNYKLYLESSNKMAPATDTFTRTELYDVVNDPFESQNLVALHPAIVQEYTEILRAYPNYDSSRWPTSVAARLETYKSPNLLINDRC